jgi:glutaconate CoA-transferase subunit A
MPARTFSGTDMLSVRPDLALVSSPYSADRYVAIPALVPDVAIVHAWCADRAGNAVLRSEYCLDVDLAAAARFTIVTAEHIVPTSDIEAHGADIIAAHVEHVVCAPRGAWPSSCYPDYRADLSLLMDYADACRAAGFEGFLADFLQHTTPP